MQKKMKKISKHQTMLTETITIFNIHSEALKYMYHKFTINDIESKRNLC
jgi:hypothetical protein